MPIEYYNIAKLPIDIILFEIFSRLPVKSLIRFRCVCKSWSSLIRHPFFVRTYQKLQTQSCHNHHLLLRFWNPVTSWWHLLSAQFNQEGSISTTDILLSHDGRLICSNMVSINGLICVYSIEDLVDDDNRLHHHAPTELDNPVIFNLCTRESITLPHALNTSRSHYLVHSTWIGFSPQTNENKVLQVLVRRHHTNESSFIFKIFTLGGTSSSWRHLEIEDKDFDDLALDYQNLLFKPRSVFLHGARHWLETNIKDELVILVFDFEQERFRVIPLPQEYHKDRGGATPFVEMIEVNECVAINDLDFSSEGNVISLWILKDYQHLVWVKESIIFPTKWKKMGFPFPRCSIYTGELLLRGPCCTCEVLLYNLNNKRFTTIQDSMPQILGSYHESIFPLAASPEREQICQSLTCENLTPEVRIQAANSRNLPLRTVVELFYLNNQELKDEVEEHKNRISYLESVSMKMNEVIENLRKEVEKLGSGNSKGSNKWTTMSKKLGFSKKPLQLGCRTSQDAVHNPNPRRKDNILPENTDSSSEE